MRIKPSISLLCIVFLSAQAAPLFAQAPLQKVTISYSSSGITSIEFFIAKEKQFFREEGLEPLLVQMSANAAIAAGAHGACLSGGGSSLIALASSHFRNVLRAMQETAHALGVEGTGAILRADQVGARVLNIPRSRVRKEVSARSQGSECPL